MNPVYLEKLYGEFLGFRDHLSNHRGTYTLPGDIPVFAHPLDRLFASTPFAFKQVEEMRDQLIHLGFKNFEFPAGSPIYSRSLGKYVELLVKYAKDGIDPHEAESLFSISLRATNPEIPLLFRQLVLGGSFVTRHNSGGLPGDRDVTILEGANLCLNFGEKPVDLPCNSLGILGLSYNVLEPISVEPATIEWKDASYRSIMASRIKRENIPPLQAIQEIREHLPNATLVAERLPEAYEGVETAEAAMVITGVLLNIFAISEGIDSETRNLYGSMLDDAVKNAGKRIIKKIESLQLDPGTSTLFQNPENQNMILSVEEGPLVKEYFEKVKVDMQLAVEIHSAHVSWMQGHLNAEGFARYKKVAENDQKSIQIIQGFYNSWMNLRSNLLNPQYLEAINVSKNGMKSQFHQNSADPYDQFFSKFGFGGDDFPELGLIGGFIAGGRFARGIGPGFGGFATTVAVYLPPIISGMVIENALQTSFSMDERLPVPYFLPRLWGVPAYIPQDDFKSK